MALYYIKESGTVVKEKEEDIAVLSPSLYWFAHADFPTSSLAKAKRLADSFLSSRPSSYTAIYVEKRGDGFDCYAYDKERISELLKECGCSDAPLYFLQQFAEQLPLRIDDNLAAQTLNGVAIEVAQSQDGLSSLDSLDFGSLARPINKRSVGISKIASISLLVLLLFAAAGDLALRYQTLEAIKEKSASLGGGKSMYEIKALLKNYKKVDIEQRRLRNTIKKALGKKMKMLECTPKKGCSYE